LLKDKFHILLLFAFCYIIITIRAGEALLQSKLNMLIELLVFKRNFSCRLWLIRYLLLNMELIAKKLWF